MADIIRVWLRALKSWAVTLTPRPCSPLPAAPGSQSQGGRTGSATVLLIPLHADQCCTDVQLASHIAQPIWAADRSIETSATRLPTAKSFTHYSTIRLANGEAKCQGRESSSSPPWQAVQRSKTQLVVAGLCNSCKRVPLDQLQIFPQVATVFKYICMGLLKAASWAAGFPQHYFNTLVPHARGTRAVAGTSKPS